MNLNKDNLCIYHHNCVDGFGSAWVVKQAIPDVEFFGGIYYTNPPDVKDKNVFMVDFSYKRDVVLRLAKQAKSIIIIDHHFSAKNDLIDLPNNVHTIFDLNHSGAILTWNYFYPDTIAPDLLFFIEDRDLWKFKLKNTDTIQASLFSYPYDFDVWDRLMNTSCDILHNEGTSILKKLNKDINELLQQTTREMIIGGYKVKIANLPYTMCSEAGNILAKNAPFGGTYYDTPEKRVFSLRSTNEGIDVSRIAELYGGGGHRNAAGFKVSYSQALEFEITGN